MNRTALFGLLICIVLGIMFLPISASITMRRHQEALGCKRIKTFELVKANVTLCLAATRVLCVLAVVDLPKVILVHYGTGKHLTKFRAIQINYVNNQFCGKKKIKYNCQNVGVSQKNCIRQISLMWYINLMTHNLEIVKYSFLSSLP